jgi:hypothetical protein
MPKGHIAGHAQPSDRPGRGVRALIHAIEYRLHSRSGLDESPGGTQPT